MADASILKRVRSSITRFSRAEGGNVAVLFGIAILPILGFVGSAIDYSRVNNARTAMQAALDTTALMISKDATSTMTAAEINQKAQTYFASLYNHPEAQNLVVNAAYTNSTSQGSQIVVTGSASMATDFMKVVGYPTIDFGASSTTVWGTTKLRVALVLDNTGSMSSSGKMTALKTAASNLLDTLKTAAKTDGDVYVSIIPFAKDVNVSSIATTSTKWLRWDLGTCTTTSGRSTTTQGFMTQTECNAISKSTWTATTKTGWTGCVSDRNQNYDTLSTAPASTTATDPNAANLATQLPAENYSDCPVSILPLTYDWTALKDKVNAMQPTGNTNQSIGLAWGWLSLLQQNPLNAPAEDSNFKYTKVIVLLSDGDNTQNRFSSSVTAIDARQKILCDNAKAAGITIYTIQVNTDGSNTSSVLSYCASSSNNFFSTTTASGIAGAFSSIGSALSKLRIAK
jgi:Flp pilus assembly protein TadG